MEGVEEDVEPGIGGIPFQDVVEQVVVALRPDARQPPQALLENQRQVQVIPDGGVEVALVVQHHRHLGARCTVKVQPEVTQLSQARQLESEGRLSRRIDVGLLAAALQPPDAVAAAQAFSQVAAQHGDAVPEGGSPAEAAVGPIYVQAGVLLEEVDLAVEAHRLGRGHAGAVATNTAEAIAVGADDEVDVG